VGKEMKKVFSVGLRNSIGQLALGKYSSDPRLKPFDQKVLTKKELAILDRLFNKIHEAKERFHKAGKCVIENEGIWPCEADIRLAEGKVHHYPNGYYI